MWSTLETYAWGWLFLGASLALSELTQINVLRDAYQLRCQLLGGGVRVFRNPEFVFDHVRAFPATLQCVSEVIV